MIRVMRERQAASLGRRTRVLVLHSQEWLCHGPIFPFTTHHRDDNCNSGAARGAGGGAAAAGDCGRASIASASRITARCGDGRGWVGWEGSGKTATRPAICCGNRGAAASAEVHALRSLAHRALAAAGSIRLAAGLVRADGGTPDGLAAASIPALGPYPERGNTSIVSRWKTARRVRATHVHRGRIYRASHRSGPARQRGGTAQGHRGHDGEAEREYDNWALDVLDSGCPAFHGLPFVGVL